MSLLLPKCRGAGPFGAAGKTSVESTSIGLKRMVWKNTGTPQGDPASPALFITYLEWFMNASQGTMNVVHIHSEPISNFT